MSTSWLSSAFKKVNKLEPRQVAIIFAIVGLVVFFTGLNNPFQGDDSYQIVNNEPVHSITHVVQFFESSTFYNGQKLTGVYYRPLMTTIFSLIYTFFGAHPIAYHIVQLALYVAGTFLLYLIFKRFIKPVLALALALIFLVHPINSQIVYSIPTMQDTLLLFFGTLGFWALMNYESTKSMIWAAVCLFLAMLSKETGLLFTFIALLYLVLFDRKRLRTFAGIMVLPVLAYLALKINAVGLNTAQHAGPIDDADLGARLLTAPSIIWFYVAKLIFPWKLATGYYWVNSSFSVKHVLLPLLADLAILGGIIYTGFRTRKKHRRAYWFFTAWMIVAILPYLQIIPLDLTASESWVYLAFAGLLGMIGVALQTVKVRFRAEWLLIPLAVLLLALGVRSVIRGADYSSQYKLALRDLSVSRNSPSALDNISQYFMDHGKYKEAAAYSRRSINIYPVASNYINLGAALEKSGDYKGAVAAYNKALKYGNMSITYENLGLIYLVYYDPSFTSRFFQKALNEYPHDFKLWLYLAIFDGATGNQSGAKTAMNNAIKYGSVPQVIYDGIMQNRPFALPLLGKTILIR
jgi:hypothetical protein